VLGERLPARPINGLPGMEAVGGHVLGPEIERNGRMGHAWPRDGPFGQRTVVAARIGPGQITQLPQ